MRAILMALAVFVFILGVAPLRAETLVIGMSSDTFDIGSNFAGGRIEVFGTIERDAATVPRPGGYDIAIVVRGPRDEVVTRQKDRVAGIWINASSTAFEDVPLYYAMLSNRPLEEIASDTLLVRQGIGTAYLRLTPDDDEDDHDRAEDGVGEDAETVAYRDALVRLKAEQALYVNAEDKVMFLSENGLFRASIPLPTAVPVGPYEVEVFLFRDGAILAREALGFDVRKVGFEQFVYDLAHSYPLFYGIGAVILAIFTGWAAGVVFRKD